MSWDQIHSYLDHIEDPIYQTLVLLDLQTGLRRSEILGLQWRDVDFSAGTLSVHRALVKLPSERVELTVLKNGRGRVVNLPEESLDALAVLRQRKEVSVENGDFLFCHSDGSPMDPDHLTKWFKRLTQNAGSHGLRLHDLRHTHASLMLSKGIHLKIVSERLGHSSIAITANLYSHVLPSVQQEAAEHIGQSGRGRMANVI